MVNLDMTAVPQLATANSFTNSQTVTATDVGITALQVEAADTTAANTAIQGVANGPNAIGVSGQANNGSTAVGVLGISSSGLAVEFNGNVSISGKPFPGGEAHSKSTIPLIPKTSTSTTLP